MINVKLKDNSVIPVDEGASGLELAKKLSSGLAKKAVAYAADGVVKDLSVPITQDCSVSILTFDDADGRWVLRHTGAHILAQAVKRLYPDVKLAIGPAIDNGFYYDFDTEKPFLPEDLVKIEKEMEKIIQEDLPLKRFELPRQEAIALMQKQGEPYKVELIEDLPEDAIISFYSQGEFTDLCAGSHVLSTGAVKNVKLLNATGAYWRGDSSRKMLQRIYGTAFPKKAELDEYLNRLEEAKKRDHRRIGRELDLFDLYEDGPGFPFFLPKGMVLKNLLINYWREVHTRYGYQEIQTPIILNEELWHRSGHWDHYKDNMYTTKIDDKNYCIKPMNCPGGMLVYKRRMYSYRDLPQRMAELGIVHRNELSGALHGLMRVRCFTQDDAHLYMTEDQIESEVNGIMKLIDEIYSVFGFKYYIELSTRPEKAMGSKEVWDAAEQKLQAVLDKSGRDYKINPGDGAFYGPKIDFHLEDAIGRTWQCGTIQLDFQMPELFDLTYVGPDGEKHRPAMLHRTALGSMERFIGILTEHYAGAFPLWLAPVQATVLPISDKNHPYAEEIFKKAEQAGIRIELDNRSEKIGYRIREAQLQKIPYMLVLGDKEEEGQIVAVRDRRDGKTSEMTLDQFIQKVRDEVESKG